MKKEIAKIFTYLAQKIWHFYDNNLRSYKIKNYLLVDVSKPLPGDAMAVLVKVCKALDDFQVPYCLGWGTALGIYRDGRLISHDNDLDLDIFNFSNFDLVVDALKSIDIKLARKVLYNHKIQQLVFLSDSGVIVDLVFWRRKWKSYINYCEPGYILKLSLELVQKGRRVFRNNTNSFMLLKEEDVYLTAVYGADWRVPKHSKGDWKDDCKIIQKKFDPIWHLYKKIAPFYLKIKNRLYPTAQVPEEFFALNKDFWLPIPQYEKSFLVDLTIHDHEYYNVHLISAIALSKILEARPVVLLPKRHSGEVARLVNSYGIFEIIYLENYKVSVFVQSYIFFKSIYLWLKNRTKENLLRIKFNNIIVGHMIYDEYIGSTRHGTVRVWDPGLVKVIFRALRYYYQYKQIFDSRIYILYFGVEQIYARAGMASVAAINGGIKLFLRKYGPNQVTYKTYSKPSDLYLFPTHPEKHDFEYQLKYNAETAIEWSNTYINNLFHGNVDKYDWNARNAYANARPIDQAQYGRVFKGNYRYRAFILSHVFVDAVHCYREGIFPDYEVWLRETLKIAAQRKDTLWIVKPHPSDKYYSARYTSKGVYEEFGKYDNIRLFPEDTLTSNLVDKMDVILTFRGTAAGEYSCVGVPVITAGRSMFDEGDFLISPKDREEYKRVLLNTQFSRLSEDQIKRAKIYLYVYNFVNRVNLPLLSDLVLASPHAATPEEIYSHLILKIKNNKGENIFSDDYLNFIKNKLKN